jgi:serine-threonine kinase receptor-associated protein
VSCLCAKYRRPELTPRLDDGTYLLISSCKDGNPMLRSWLGDWVGTFLGGLWPRHDVGRCSGLTRRAQGCSVVIKDQHGRVARGDWQRRLFRVRRVFMQCAEAGLTRSKIWDCNSGEALHTFAHKHIVRSVALSPQPQPQYLLTVSARHVPPSTRSR